MHNIAPKFINQLLEYKIRVMYTKKTSITSFPNLDKE